MSAERFMEKRLYRVLPAVMLGVLGIAGCIFLYFHNPAKAGMIPCIIYEVTGFYCPGCGAGRACYSILHGQFYQAFCYNPLLIILLPWLALYILISGMQWVIWGRETVSMRIPVWIPYVVLAIVLLYGIMRNIPIYPFTLLAPNIT